jgi:hypothetical protein
MHFRAPIVHLTLVLPIAALVSLLCVLHGTSAPSINSVTHRPVVSMHGRTSKITDRRILRITREEEWKALWFEHKYGVTDSKDIPDDFEFVDADFDKHMVIAIFSQRDNSKGLTAHTILEDDDHLTIRLNEHCYQSLVIAGGAPPPVYQPWGVFVLPRSAKEIVLETDERDLIADPPSWKKWKTIAAISRLEKP